MKFEPRSAVRRLRELLRETERSPAEMAMRLEAVERDVILPVKGMFILLICYNFFFARWFENENLPQTDAQQGVERFFLLYLICNVGVAALLWLSPRLPGALTQRVIFSSNFLDGLMMAALTLITGGFDSTLYWLFLGLIVRNALSCPLALPQIVLNLSLSVCYFVAGIFEVTISDEFLTSDTLNRGDSTISLAEPFLLRLIVLWLWTACCYGVQLVFEKHRKAAEETREFNARQEQLRSAGRLAAQIAHQIKNPLGIINNAAYLLHRAAQEGKPAPMQQIEIIREEVEHADRTIVKLMGYAQLAEGKVERLHMDEEIDRAIAEVFPPAAKYPIVVEKQIAPHLPPLLMQRGHLSEILVNLLQNSREAFPESGPGRIQISARHGEDSSIDITIADDGPGISKARLEKIFQPYFSTKSKGSGLGLAIVRHNTEIYGGTVRVESELGKGTCFVLHFPTRTFMKLKS